MKKNDTAPIIEKLKEVIDKNGHSYLTGYSGAAEPRSPGVIGMLSRCYRNHQVRKK